MRGKFITIEGGEGVGKSFFLENLSKSLNNMGISFICTREPGGTSTAARLRDIFVNPPKDDPLTIEAEFCIVSAARSQHVQKVIVPALDEGKWVISDRFADSSRVYQGHLGGLDSNIVETIIKFTTRDLEPDLTFLLDCPVSICLARLANRVNEQRKKGENHIEISRFDQAKEAFHEKLRKSFLELQKRFPSRIVVLATDRSPTEIAEEAVDIIKQRLLKSGI